MKKTINRLFLMLSLAIICTSIGCKGQIVQMQCFEESLKKFQNKPIYSAVQDALHDTLQNWMFRKLKGVQSLKHSDWKIDEAVFFNESFNKAILLILKRDTQRIVNFRTKENPELRPPTQDNIETVFGYLENDKWQFYTRTMPTIVVIRERYGKKEAMTFNELSQIGRKEVLMSYYKPGSCQINIDCFKVNMDELRKNHQKFLTNDPGAYGHIEEE